jgi:hypothetical protein
VVEAAVYTYGGVKTHLGDKTRPEVGIEITRLPFLENEMSDGSRSGAG